MTTDTVAANVFRRYTLVHFQLGVWILHQAPLQNAVN